MTDERFSSLGFQSDLIRTRGSNEGSRICRSIMTCVDRQHFSRKRLNDLKQVLHDDVAPHLDDWLSTGDLDSAVMWQIRMLANEAVHHLHSAADPLVAAIYWFSVSNTNRRIRDRDLSLFKVRQCQAIDPKYREPLNEIATHNAHLYLAALNNRAKHVHIVRESLPLLGEASDLTAQEVVLFESFKKPTQDLPTSGGAIRQHFSATAIVPFLEAESQRFATLFNQLVGAVRDDLDVEIAALS